VCISFTTSKDSDLYRASEYNREARRVMDSTSVRGKPYGWTLTV